MNAQVGKIDQSQFAIRRQDDVTKMERAEIDALVMQADDETGECRLQGGDTRRRQSGC